MDNSCFGSLAVSDYWQGEAQTIPQARARDSIFYGLFYGLRNFSWQKSATLCNAVRTGLPLVGSEKHAAQRREKLRENPSLN